MKAFWLFYPLAVLALGSANPPPSAAPDSPILPYGDLACAPEDATCARVLPGTFARPVRTGPATIAERDVEDEGQVRILVSLPQQRAWVFRGEELVATAPVSTGKPGHETPVGRFRILQKKVHHRSNRYSNAPMPYMQRLTDYGIALHAGHLPGYPASHGCIRLPQSFARKLYGITDFKTRVTVTRAKPKSARAALVLA